MSGNNYRLLLSYETVPTYTYSDDTIAEKIPNPGFIRTYLVAFDGVLLETLDYMDDSCETIAFDGTFSVHGTLKGHSNLHIIYWTTKTLVVLGRSYLVRRWIGAFTAYHLILAHRESIAIYTIQSLREAAMGGETDGGIHHPTMINLPHPVEEGIFGTRICPVGSTAILLWQNSLHLSAIRLSFTVDMAECDTEHLWSLPIDRSQYISAAAIDGNCGMAYWLQHEVAVARRSCAEGSSSIFSVPLEKRATDSSASIRLLYRGQDGDITTHCEFMAVDSLKGRLVLAPKVARRALLLQSPVSVSENGETIWQAPASDWLCSITSAREASIGDEVYEHTMMGEDLICGMRLFPTPSLAWCWHKPLPVCAEQLPTGFVPDVDDVMPSFCSVPTGALAALVLGYGIRKFPRMFGHMGNIRIASRDLEMMQVLYPDSTELPESQVWKLQSYVFPSKDDSVFARLGEDELNEVPTMSGASMLVEEAISNDLTLLAEGDSREEREQATKRLGI
ncbi:hypothetical protein DACRYDRAFT_107134 [Dacryopinax primogenitus]|uniref:Uncharacterized protein n=1 Tax=Dacryopinax primogenitus (strain DJM 731) TaxID=1858805 RepID=M5G8N6_DACPD|nr:uncharacterized protein DACRYDRAFT_107134 [Dacryopinax primogenitus]EJU02197.1 hypothetical protein DACRYDRAFT_107134 [Dacryopinax primogenitus]